MSGLEVTMMKRIGELNEEVKRLQAEVERLTAENETIRKDRDLLFKDHQQLAADNHRLLYEAMMNGRRPWHEASERLQDKAKAAGMDIHKDGQP